MNPYALRACFLLGWVVISHRELQTLPVFRSWSMLLFGNTSLGLHTFQQELTIRQRGDSAMAKQQSASNTTQSDIQHDANLQDRS